MRKCKNKWDDKRTTYRTLYKTSFILGTVDPNTDSTLATALTDNENGYGLQSFELDTIDDQTSTDSYAMTLLYLNQT